MEAFPADSPKEDLALARDALHEYVHGTPRSGAGLQDVSCMRALLRDARGATLRCPDDGKPLGGEPSPSWLGTIGYLVLLEQIGKAVYDTTKPALTAGLKRAITHFGPTALPDAEQDALKGLRNAYAHDYGLVSAGIWDSKRQVYTGGLYAFQLVPRAKHLVELRGPTHPWPNSQTYTAATVAVVDLADYVERVVANVEAASGRGELASDLPGGDKELEARFLFKHFSA